MTDAPDPQKTKITIDRIGHCSNCAYYTASIELPDGTRREAESREQGSEDEAIGRLIRENPDIFGELEIVYVGAAKAQHDYIERILEPIKGQIGKSSTQAPASPPDTAQVQPAEGD